MTDPRRIVPALAATVMAVALGCGNTPYGEVPDVSAALDGVPYKVTLREVEVGPDSQEVTVGRAVSGSTSLDFLVAPKAALDHLPKLPLTNDGGSIEPGGFVFESNAYAGKRDFTAAERTKRQEMSLRIENALCEEASGGSCGV